MAQLLIRCANEILHNEDITNFTETVTISTEMTAHFIIVDGVTYLSHLSNTQAESTILKDPNWRYIHHGRKSFTVNKPHHLMLKVAPFGIIDIAFGMTGGNRPKWILDSTSKAYAISCHRSRSAISILRVSRDALKCRSLDVLEYPSIPRPLFAPSFQPNAQSFLTPSFIAKRDFSAHLEEQRRQYHVGFAKADFIDLRGVETVYMRHDNEGQLSNISLRREDALDLPTVIRSQPSLTLKLLLVGLRRIRQIQVSLHLIIWRFLSKTPKFLSQDSEFVPQIPQKLRPSPNGREYLETMDYHNVQGLWWTTSQSSTSLARCQIGFLQTSMQRRFV